jgi:hypothetical protein|uniref:Protein BatD n=1 Tax=candidate division WOR-3 bacterium TaxID=2052148 RepID=A0A7V3VTP0_UNCW3
MMWLILFFQIEAKAELAKDYLNKKLAIGDPFEIIVELTVPINKNVSEPFIDSIEPFAITNHTHKIIQEKGIAKHRFHFQAVAFNTGELKFPPFKFVVKDENKIDTVLTNQVDIKVHSVLTGEMKDINDIKGMIDFPNPLPVVISLIIIGAGIISFFGIRFYKRLKQKRFIEEKKIPCWDRAINAIEALLKEDYLSKGLVKKFYYTLTEILKRYLEERFQFPAVEQTTTEIFHSMKSLKIPLREDFQHIFSYADMVKYAKFIPPFEETQSIIQKSKELIIKTIPQETQGGEGEVR